jgi:3-oxoacyl-[acyl-carrier protein] reductase
MKKPVPVTLITGTRVGIGKFLAQHYAASGHCVVGCSRGPVDWEARNYEHHVCDVIDENVVRSLFLTIRKKYGRLDHLINNAGTASMNHTLLTPISTVHRLLDTNVVGTFLFSREAAKIMKNRGYGRIVNFTSVAVAMKLPGEAAYVASKAAVLSLTQVMAYELADFGITVNAVGPVPIETDLIRAVPKEKIMKLIERQAVRRLGRFEDIVNIVDFFLRRESEMVTGQNLFLGGV